MSDKRRQTRKPQLRLQYMADSAEQVAKSINRIGLRDKLDEAFEAAIARARSRPSRQGINKKG